MRVRPRGRTRRRGRVAAALAVLALFVAVATAVPSTTDPAPARASYGISTGKGFDACAFPTIAQMNAWWNNTPFWNYGFYLGGSDAGCPAPVTSSWLTQAHAIGWKFLVIWVGPQPPCSSEPSRFSSDPATARQQGRNEALASYNKAKAVGIDTTDLPVIYDLENFPTNNSSCLAATRSFIQGWDEQQHVAPAQKAGLYGSVCGSALQQYASLATPPDFVDGANWNGVISTKDLSAGGCGVASTSWTNHQRHKQYAGGHNETWNGVTFNVDSDCSNAPVYPGPTDNANQGCV